MRSRQLITPTLRRTSKPGRRDRGDSCLSSSLRALALARLDLRLRPAVPVCEAPLLIQNILSFQLPDHDDSMNAFHLTWNLCVHQATCTKFTAHAKKKKIAKELVTGLKIDIITRLQLCNSRASPTTAALPPAVRQLGPPLPWPRLVRLCLLRCPNIGASGRD
jgi:hypothetical protein